jgi:hypothetical protein
MSDEHAEPNELPPPPAADPLPPPADGEIRAGEKGMVVMPYEAAVGIPIEDMAGGLPPVAPAPEAPSEPPQSAAPPPSAPPSAADSGE